MGYVKGVDRNQATIVTLDVMVAPDSEARLVDAFVDSLDLEKLGFRPPAAEGRPAYDPRSMLKLYVWGYRKGVRSSRKLAASCRENVEAMWLVSGVRPDFRTISDFRKDNAEALRKVFSALVERLSGAVAWGFCSVDGSKFRASNSKANNFTASKLDDRIEWLERHVDEYLGALDEADAGGADATGPLTRELVEAKLAEARKRLELYRGYRDLMEREGLSQLSLTDPDARLMRSGGGFAVAYNPQTAVDSETHLIRDFEMTNAPTDHGQLLPTMARVAQASDGVVEVVADKGYRQSEDMAACLEAGVLPHVIAGDGARGHEVELPHEPAEGLDPSSEDPAELSRCLRAGEVPEAYEGVVAKAEVRTVRRRVPDGPAAEPYGTREEMEARAAEGYFVRDPLRELVVCPAGETLRRKGTGSPARSSTPTGRRAGAARTAGGASAGSRSSSRCPSARTTSRSRAGPGTRRPAPCRTGPARRGGATTTRPRRSSSWSCGRTSAGRRSACACRSTPSARSSGRWAPTTSCCAGWRRSRASSRSCAWRTTWPGRGTCRRPYGSSSRLSRPAGRRQAPSRSRARIQFSDGLPWCHRT